MPYIDATRTSYPSERLYITWRAKFLAAWSGEMSIASWLPPGVEPDRPIPWNARVMIGRGGFPVVYIDGQRADFCLWPDGKTEPT